jgi:hypothetical protein
VKKETGVVSKRLQHTGWNLTYTTHLDEWVGMYELPVQGNTAGRCQHAQHLEHQNLGRIQLRLDWTPIAWPDGYAAGMGTRRGDGDRELYRFIQRWCEFSCGRDG